MLSHPSRGTKSLFQTKRPLIKTQIMAHTWYYVPYLHKGIPKIDPLLIDVEFKWESCDWLKVRLSTERSRMDYNLAIASGTYLHIICVQLLLNNNPTGIFQPMHSYSEFDGESDFAIKRCLNPRFDWVTEGQSQNLVKWRHNDGMGKERVKVVILNGLIASF